MKSISKLMLAGAFAVAAIAVSAAPSEAAKRAKAPKACTPGTSCTMAKTNVMHHCFGDGKWVAALLPACQGAGCPPACPK
jgi:hypothetical protein